MRLVAKILVGVLAGSIGAGARAQSFGCRRAQETVEDVKRQYQAGNPDHRRIIERLREAMAICPESGEVFRLAACSAQAVGDARAEGWRSRAVLNRSPTTGCDELGGASATGAAAAPGPMPGFVRRKLALVVGIGSFADAEIPTLQYPAKDARDFARTLTDPGVGRFAAGDVRVLTDAQATRAAILDALQELILTAQPEDLVVLFVSSHGSPNREGAGLAGVGYIVTHDTAKKSIWRDALEYRAFAEKVELIRARRKVLFLDTCFSGQVARPGAKALVLEGGGLSEATARMFLSGEGSYLITSSRDNERSWESDALHNGYFTHFLIEALRKGPQPPSVREVFDHVARTVPVAVARDKQEPQHPMLFPSDGHAEVRIGVMPRDESAPGSPP